MGKVELGSPLAYFEYDGSNIGSATQIFLCIDIFGYSEDSKIILNNLWSSNEPLIKLKLNEANINEIKEIVGKLELATNKKLKKGDIEKILGFVKEFDPKTKSLTSISGTGLGSTSQLKIDFSTIETPNNNQLVEILDKVLKVKLKVKILDKEHDLFCLFKINLGTAEDEDEDVDVVIGADFIYCFGGIVKLQTVNKSFGDLISLNIPEGTIFFFDANPLNISFTWMEKSEDLIKALDPLSFNVDSGLQPPNDKKISIKIPGRDENDINPINDEPNKEFTFELSKFKIHNAGIDLRGAVKGEFLTFGDPSTTGLKETIVVKEVEKSEGKAKSTEPKIGEIEFKNSRLVYGSLQASVKLSFFDDAKGTLTLALSEDTNTKQLNFAGTLDVVGSKEFTCEMFFTKFLVKALQLKAEYKNKRWQCEGAMSGTVKFQPPMDRSANELGELSELFSGISLDFESINPVNLGFQKIKLLTPPKQFNFAQILTVDLRGIEIMPGKKDSDGGEILGNIKLLGDVNIKKIPGVDASLTFGGIEIVPDFPPRFSVEKIGAQFSIGQGLSMEGVLQFLETDVETGFAGMISIKSKTLPQMTGMLKLTRIRAKDGAIVPSIAVFVESEIEASLLAGFFLRKLGVGIGIRQALRGLEPKPGVKLSEKILDMVNNGAGLPDPRKPETWVPVQPEKAGDPIYWTLVATGLITFQKLASTEPHVMTGNLVFSIDSNLQIFLGTNVWLFSSPDEIATPDFALRPAARGAIGLSFEEGRLFAAFRSIKNPKMNEKAPKLLTDILSKAETSLMFLADRNGFIIELGWPWETRLHHEIGLFKGQAELGFRFGIYSGAMVFGLNFAIAVKFDISKSISFNAGPLTASASLTAQIAAYLRASFMGAIDKNLNAYLFGEVRFAVKVNLLVEASWSISIKIFGRRFSKRFGFSKSLSIALDVLLVAAINSVPSLGLRGQAKVAVSVCGYTLEGNVAFSSNDNIIEETKNKINSMLPPISTVISNFGETIDQTLIEECWHYRVWQGKVEKGEGQVEEVVRVLLFPAPGVDYLFGEKKITINENLKKNFRGFVGSNTNSNGSNNNDNKYEIKPKGSSFELIWKENLKEVVISTDEIVREIEKETGNISTLDKKQIKDQTLGDLRDKLKARIQASNKIGGRQIEDKRIMKPSFADVDDSTAGLSSIESRSHNFKSNSLYDKELTKVWDPNIQNDVRNLELGRKITTFLIKDLEPDFALDLVNLLNKGDLSFLTLNDGQKYQCIKADRGGWFVCSDEKIYLLNFINQASNKSLKGFSTPTINLFEIKNASDTKDLLDVDVVKKDLEYIRLNKKLPVDVLTQVEEKFVNLLENDRKNLDYLKSYSLKFAKEQGKDLTQVEDLIIRKEFSEKFSKVGMVEEEVKQIFKNNYFLIPLIEASPTLTQWLLVPYPTSESVFRNRGELNDFYRVIYKIEINSNKLVVKGVKLTLRDFWSSSKKERTGIIEYFEKKGEKDFELLPIFLINALNKNEDIHETFSEFTKIKRTDFYKFLIQTFLPDGKIDDSKKSYFVVLDKDLAGISIYEALLTDTGEELNTGLLFTDLVSLLKNEKVKAGESFKKDYKISRLLNLVLEFKAGQDVTSFNDGITIGDKTFKLISPTSSNSNSQNIEYDLIAGPPYQSAHQICLAWEFKKENSTEEDDIFDAYLNLEEFTVIRTNLSNPDGAPIKTSIYPSWIKGGNKLIKPQYQFVDKIEKESQNAKNQIKEGDLLQYEVIAKGVERDLCSCIINVVRRTVEPLPSLKQASALLCSLKQEAKILFATSFTKKELEEILKFSQKLENLKELEITLEELKLLRKKLQGFLGDEEKQKSEERVKDLEKRIKEIRRIIKLKYRLIPASTVGSYGFERRPSIKTKWVHALPSREEDNDFPTVKFASSENSTSIPWEETEDFGSPLWENFQVYSFNDSFLVFWEIAFEKNNLKQGDAVEFYLGLEKDAENGESPTFRSPLSRCRHALDFTVDTQSQNNADDYGGLAQTDKIFSLGNLVEAFEFGFLDGEVGQEFLDTSSLSVTVDYSENNETKPVLQLCWNHDLSRRGCHHLHLSSDNKNFDPVIGYRIYLIDKYDPNHYPISKEGLWKPNKEISIKVLPDLIYRANPTTIEVRKFPVQNLDEVASKDGKGIKLQNFDQALKKITNSEKSKNNFVGDWTIAKKPEDKKIDERNVTNKLPTELLLKRATDRVECEVGGVWLHKDIQNFLNDLAKSMGNNVRCKLSFHKPLADKVCQREENTTSIVVKKFVELQKEMESSVDPYGWWISEALGLSCECHFVDETNTPIRAEKLYKQLENNSSPVTTIFFYAEDKNTLLNVIRVVYNSFDVLEGSQPNTYIHTTLFGQLVGWCHYRKDSSPVGGTSINEAIIKETFNYYKDLLNPERLLVEQENKKEEWSKVITSWYQELKERLIFSGVILLEPCSRRVFFQHEVIKSHNEASRKSTKQEQNQLSNLEYLTLPINPEGLIKYSIEVPDFWAHEYSIIIEKIRRYDAIKTIKNAANSSSNSGDANFEIGNKAIKMEDKSQKTVYVDRTLPLIPHNILATPLPGSIQALVFRHPASFAATSSAVNQVFGQYSGQSVVLQRRINERDIIIAKYNSFFSDNKLNAEKYANWAENQDTKISPSLPQVLDTQEFRVTEASLKNLKEKLESDIFTHTITPLSPLKDKNFVGQELFVTKLKNILGNKLEENIKELILRYTKVPQVNIAKPFEPISNTESDMYGVDRYIFPDLPAYYQYRVGVYSTAGRVYSEPQFTPWVEPIYDQDRQRPKALKPIFEDVGGKKNIKIPLVYMRFHLMETLRLLWKDAEEKINIPEDNNESNNINFGSLPDLELTYLLYFWQNHSETEKVYLPLLRISPSNEGYKIENVNNLILSLDSSHGSNDLLIPKYEQDGGINLILTLKDIIGSYSNNFKERIFLSVQRKGIYSKIVPVSN